MDSGLTTRDVFEMAQQLEKHGAQFYRQAAEMMQDAEAAKLFRNLANLETEHEMVFGALEEQALAAPSPKKPSDPMALQIKLAYHGLLQKLRQDLVERFRDKNAQQEILREAIAFEKDTIVFFLQLKQAVATAPEADKIDLLVREELGHLFALNSHMIRIYPTSEGQAAYSAQA